MSFTYRGLKGQLERHTVTEQEVEQQIQQILHQNPKITTVTDRPARNGDEVMLDYAGFCDGVQFPGGTAKDQTLVLGSGAFIPGFEEQLVGAVCGEEVTVNVTFPEQYHAPDLAGKAAQFRCTIHGICQKTPYEPDDTFAREVGGCESFEAFRAKLERSMQAYADDKEEMQLQDRLMRLAAQSLDFTPDEDKLEEQTRQQIQSLSAQLAQQGLNLALYCQITGTTEEQLRIDARANAEDTLRSEAAVDEIARLEGLKAEEAEVEQAVNIICRQNGMTREQLEPYYNAQFEAAVVKSVISSKVLRLIRDAAEVTQITR